MANLNTKQIAQSGATTGQVLAWNGTIYAPTSSITAVTGAPRFEVDSTGELSDLTKLFSYHPLSEVAGNRNDMLNRIPLTDVSNVGCAIAGGPSTQEMVVADFNDASGTYLKNDSVADWWSTTTAFSGSVWARFDSLPPNTEFDAIVSRIQSDGGGGWIVCIEGTANQKLNFRFLDGVGVDALSHGVDLEINVWYHLAWAWNGTTRYLWVNGANQASDTPARTPSAADATSTSFHVGRINSGATPLPLDGRLCHLAQWRGYTLTTARALELYNGGTPNRLRY